MIPNSGEVGPYAGQPFPFSMAELRPLSRNAGEPASNEFEYPADTTLMSVTDTASYIGYANHAFLEVSGYSHDQMLGRPHNGCVCPMARARLKLWITV